GAVGRGEPARHGVSLLPQHGTLVAEGPEAGTAVVVARAAGTDAAEREPGVREVEKRVVHADPAGGGLGERGVDGAPLPREDVEGERLGTVPDVREGVLEGAVGHDR